MKIQVKTTVIFDEGRILCDMNFHFSAEANSLTASLLEIQGGLLEKFGKVAADSDERIIVHPPRFEVSVLPMSTGVVVGIRGVQSAEMPVAGDVDVEKLYLLGGNLVKTCIREITEVLG